MPLKPKNNIAFVRLTEVSLNDIGAHMSDPRVLEHMPLASGIWDRKRCEEFVATKEEYWRKDGLGHWAILSNGSYAGWGGFQMEGDEWDYGLVLRPDRFGLGGAITAKALELARADPRIPYVTFLLPPSRRHLKGLTRLGAHHVDQVDYEGQTFHKYKLNTG